MLSEIMRADCQSIYFTANLIFPPYLTHHSLLHGKLIYLDQIFRECSWFRVTFAIGSVPIENFSCASFLEELLLGHYLSDL